MTPDIRPIVIGNWKMNGMRDALPVVRDVAAGFEGVSGGRIDAALCVPSTLLYVATTLSEESALAIGAQDCHPAASGAHTGDVSAEMLADCFATACIVGHSERRTDHGETDEMVHAKAAACHRAGLTAIVCIGETEAQNMAGETDAVLDRQIRGSLPDTADASNTIVAYEPVWAIGTGRTPEAGDVERIHSGLRERLNGIDAARLGGTRLLYGGSVKPGNAVELLGLSNVDGALVGGASLKTDDFLGICAAYASLS